MFQQKLKIQLTLLSRFLLNGYHNDVDYSYVIDRPSNPLCLIVMSSGFTNIKADFDAPHQKQKFAGCHAMVPPAKKANFELESFAIFDVDSLKLQKKIFQVALAVCLPFSFFEVA